MENSQSELHAPGTGVARRDGAGSTARLWLAAPLTLPLASGSATTDRAKLALIGTLLATFFLFAATTWFPGGAEQFMEYADAIVRGTTLPPEIGQRDAGYPLLIILSGYPLLHSLIPLYLIQATFAILLPLLIYESLRRLSPFVAFYTGLASIVALSPYLFMKMIHHDQTYVFFAVLTLCQLLIFVQTRQPRFLYFFTLAAIGASVARPTGNALFPLFLIVSYIAARGRIRHYAICSIVFAVSLAGYAWHRHVIFDMAHTKETPSYLGQQFFYNPYINALDYGIRLSPNVGPNFAAALDRLRQRLQPAPKDSTLIQRQYVGPPAQTEFAESYIYPFTADELIDQVLARPNWEYFTLLCEANDDRVLLAAALEIARAYPGLILQYSFRNLVHFIFDPGYKHSRYNLNPFSAEGLIFYPADGNVSGDVRALPAQAARELEFDPVASEPFIIHRVFAVTQTIWLKQYPTDIAVMTWLMCAAWLTVAAAFIDAVRWRRKNPGAGRAFAFPEGLVASIVIASLVFGYNAAITAVFAEPDFRYREIADLPAILIAGLGVIAILHWTGVALGQRRAAAAAERWDRAARWVDRFDVWPRLAAVTRAIIVIGTACAGFAAWALFMLENTSA